MLRTGPRVTCRGDEGPAREAALHDRHLHRDRNPEAGPSLHHRRRSQQPPTYSKVIHRLEMPGIRDELHHMGWNACSSCFGDSSMTRSHLLAPGFRSANIHVVDTATDPRAAPAQGDRQCRDQGQGGPQRAPHGALPGIRHHHLDARQCRGRGTGVTFTTPTGISASWADGGIPWATSRSDTISGTSRATM